MGRNATPKLGVWRDGKCYRFTTTGRAYRGTEAGYPTPDDGRMIVYEVEDGNGVEVLGACWADGFEECMASMWQSGYHKGERAGYEKAKQEIRDALGVGR